MIHFREDAARVLVEGTVGGSASQRLPESALVRVENVTIMPAAGVARLLVDLQAPVTQKMRAMVARIGEELERTRPVFAEDQFAETDAALHDLHTIFDVDPVGRRQMHDGTSPIAVSCDGWRAAPRALEAAGPRPGACVHRTGRGHPDHGGPLPF